MLRFFPVALTTLFVATPAVAHESAGIVHFITEADHVAGLIVTIALPVLFWIVWRGKRATSQRRFLRKDR